MDANNRGRRNCRVRGHQGKGLQEGEVLLRGRGDTQGVGAAEGSMHTKDVGHKF